MDTNDLTEKAFESLLIAEEIDHMVTVSLGVMCTRLSSEDDFLREAFGYVKALSENPRNFLENWGLSDCLDSEVFSLKMKNLSSALVLGLIAGLISFLLITKTPTGDRSGTKAAKTISPHKETAHTQSRAPFQIRKAGGATQLQGQTIPGRCHR